MTRHIRTHINNIRQKHQATIYSVYTIAQHWGRYFNLRHTYTYTTRYIRAHINSTRHTQTNTKKQTIIFHPYHLRQRLVFVLLLLLYTFSFRIDIDCWCLTRLLQFLGSLDMLLTTQMCLVYGIFGKLLSTLIAYQRNKRETKWIKANQNIFLG